MSLSLAPLSLGSEPLLRCHRSSGPIMFCCLPLQRYQDAPGVEHIPVVQIDLSVPLKVPGKCLPSLGNVGGIGTGDGKGDRRT